MMLTDGQRKEQMARVLNEYVKCGVIGIACDRAGLSRKIHRDWMEEYPEYKTMFEEVRDRFVDGLEAVAIERAKEKSDGLLTLMLKSHRREVYGDVADLKVTNTNAPIQLVFAEGMLSEEDKKMLSGGDDDGGVNNVSPEAGDNEDK